MDDNKVENLMKMDLYAMIGVDSTATLKEIKAAYRKTALKCHPDKNPNNPKAAEEFLQLSEILKILTDDAARGAYDQIVKAKQQAKIRSQQLDAKRRKFQDDLEAREEAHRQSLLQKNKLKVELERIEKEGARLVEEEIRLMQEQIQEQLRQTVSKSESSSDIKYQVKLKWKADKNDPSNGGYNHDLLHRILSKYGDIEILMVSSAKNGRGIAEFKTKDGAESAIQIEPGLPTNPLKLSPMWKTNENSNKSQSLNQSKVSESKLPDYEDTVLANLRRAEERKKLIEQMRKEDEEET